MQVRVWLGMRNKASILEKRMNQQELPDSTEGIVNLRISPRINFMINHDAQIEVNVALRHKKLVLQRR